MLAAGGVPIPLGPAAALPAPLVPHVFQRVTLAGRDNRLDYVACLGTAKVCTSLPNLGWVDASKALSSGSWYHGTRCYLVFSHYQFQPGHLSKLPVPSMDSTFSYQVYQLVPSPYGFIDPPLLRSLTHLHVTHCWPQRGGKTGALHRPGSSWCPHGACPPWRTCARPTSYMSSTSTETSP